MWQRVLATNPPLVEAAYEVLSTYGSRWSSVEDFTEWLQSHNDRVFYLATEEFNLVVGFRSEGGAHWRGALAGMSGNLSSGALEALLAKTTEFARERAAASLVIRVKKLPPSNPFAGLYQLAIGMVNGDPHIASVAVQNVGRSREYTLTFRGAAA